MLCNSRLLYPDYTLTFCCSFVRFCCSGCWILPVTNSMSSRVTVLRPACNAARVARSAIDMALSSIISRSSLAPSRDRRAMPARLAIRSNGKIGRKCSCGIISRNNHEIARFRIPPERVILRIAASQLFYELLAYRSRQAS